MCLHCASDVLLPALQAKMMFEGEAASLQALLQTDTVHVPKPIKVHVQMPSYHAAFNVIVPIVVQIMF